MRDVDRGLFDGLVELDGACEDDVSIGSLDDLIGILYFSIYHLLGELD